MRWNRNVYRAVYGKPEKRTQGRTICVRKIILKLIIDKKKPG
jgi:hypothetical protein